MHIKVYTKRALAKLHIAWSFHIPDILVFVALIWIVIVSGRDFFGDQNFTQTLAIYITVVGLSIAIASAVFTYQQCTVDLDIKKLLTKIGQLFLYGSISMIMALLIGWLAFNIKENIQELPYYFITQYIASFLFASNYMFFVFSVNSFYTGMKKLERHLFFEVKEDIR